MNLINVLSYLFLYLVAGFIVQIAVSEAKPGTEPLMFGLHISAWPFVVLFYFVLACVRHSER